MAIHANILLVSYDSGLSVILVVNIHYCIAGYRQILKTVLSSMIRRAFLPLVQNPCIVFSPLR
ncbi:hypothetical protein BKA66DRAFT_450773 [Pyrenochaeta sp. MPI-SDFR-AT-0127]|nr:hypothetical protein BKA66DRAFT_450773 [Pyrenochaeta sp. MPI-SDFR-AT-0127]